MTDSEVVDKFNANVSGQLVPERANRLCEEIWGLDECADVSTLTQSWGF
jgi:hypothetical protein